jgi:hypothetical protein
VTFIDEGPEPCFLCGELCTTTGEHPHLAVGSPLNPFPPKEWFMPKDDEDFVIAPHRVDDPETQRAVYGAGDRVPRADAEKYGLVDKPKAARAGARTADEPQPAKTQPAPKKAPAGRKAATRESKSRTR